MNKQPFFISNLANNITILRILLVPAFIFSLLYFSPQHPHLRAVAVSLFLFACITDALDGYVAKKFNQRSLLGSYIDPIADKLLLSSGFISLSFMPHLPPQMHIPGWVTLCVISRDVIILIGAALIFLSTGALKAAPLFAGKLTTVFQMTTLSAVLLEAPASLIRLLFVATAALTFVSGILYIRMGERMFQQGGRSS